MTKAKIYKPSKTAMQSGLTKTEDWVLEYELDSSRKPESLMGWVSSEDTLNQVRLTFVSCEDAVAYAQKEGVEYSVSHAHEKRIKPRNYGDNFKYRPPRDKSAK